MGSKTAAVLLLVLLSIPWMGIQASAATQAQGNVGIDFVEPNGNTRPPGGGSNGGSGGTVDKDRDPSPSHGEETVSIVDPALPGEKALGTLPVTGGGGWTGLVSLAGGILLLSVLHSGESGG